MTRLEPAQALCISSRGIGFTLQRSWRFLKLALSLLWNFKQLVLFPLLSIVSTLVLMVSFAVPLWETGIVSQWIKAAQEGAPHRELTLYLAAILFYFCAYFVVVFFNSALIACALQVLDGQKPSIGYGLSMARKRLPQLLGWVLVSSVLGVVLRTIENANHRGGRVISLVLGSTWSATTYFAIPLIVMDSVGPVESIRRSIETVRSNWGEALVGSFSFGLLGCIVAAPVLAAVAGLGFLAIYVGAWVLAVLSVALALLVIIIATTLNTAVDTVFKALLFAFAQGRDLPRGFNTAALEGAFVTHADQ